MPTDIVATPAIRRATVEESDAVAELMWAVREQSRVAGSIPQGIHPLEDMRNWMRNVVFRDDDVWVAEDVDRTALVALMVLRQPDWLEHLYIDAAATGRGLGSRMLEVARAELRGEQIQLWTFQSNIGARRFYERHGFVGLQTTDGDTEEKAPDVRYLWRRPRAASSPVDIRSAVAADLPAIQQIYADVVATHHASLAHSAPDLAYWQGRLADLSPQDRLLVAEDGPEVLGFAESYTFRPREGFDRTREVALYLAETARGRGVGTALYSELLTQLAAAGNRMVFATVALPNDASVLLHRRLGFQQVGLLPDIAEKFGKTWSTAYFTRRLTDEP
jgi:phosphinothricin acetyltransferase